MALSPIVESSVEEAAPEWFEALGFAALHGLDLTPGSLGGE
jgi:hypothetical protein